MEPVSSFLGIDILMYVETPSEELIGEPHFHAKYNAQRAVIAIRTGDVMDGGLSPRATDFVNEWRNEHRSELMQNWNRMFDNIAPENIAPLE